MCIFKMLNEATKKSAFTLSCNEFVFLFKTLCEKGKKTLVLMIICQDCPIICVKKLIIN